MVVLLLQRQAYVNHQNSQMQTPLFLAAQKGVTSTLKVLLEHGAKVDAVDNVGATPLWVAVKRGAFPVVALLLAHKANVNIPNQRMEYALAIASEWAQPALATILLHCWPKVVDPP